MDDPFNLQRFLDAQKPVFEQACSELREGRNSGHWMPFIFPRIKGPADNQAESGFAISSLEEATAYLKHPILGIRLRQCCLIVTLLADRSIGYIFGPPDNLKFRSSMTLFALATAENQIFKDILRRFFESETDPQTLKQLSLPKGGEPCDAKNSGQPQ